MDSPVALGNKNRDRAGDVRMFDSGVRCSAAEIKNKLNKSAAGMILYTPCHLRTEMIIIRLGPFRIRSLQ